MPDLHLRVPQAIVDEINDNLRKVTGGKETLLIDEIGKEALGLYKWAVAQMAIGNAVGAADKTGDLIVQIGTKSTPITKASA